MRHDFPVLQQLVLQGLLLLRFLLRCMHSKG